MTELWDIYTEDRVLTGKTVECDTPMGPGEMHLIVAVWLRTPDGRWLCSKRSAEKTFGGLWETTCGSVLAGEDSLTAALREVKEELGLTLDPSAGRLVWTMRRADNFTDVWLFDCPFTEKDVTLRQGETCDARICTSEEIMEMTRRGMRGEKEGDQFLFYPFTKPMTGLFDRPVYRAPVLPRGTKLTDEMWDNIPAAPVDNWLWRDLFAPETFARLALIEDEGIALRMTCFESDPIARHTEYGDEVWIDSAMECFIAKEYGGTYINIEMNSAANKLVGVGKGREGRRAIDEFYPCPSVDAHVYADHWTAQMFVPKEMLDAVFGEYECKKGARLFGNFFKVGEETGRPHYGMWSPIVSADPDFHRPEAFSEIVFE